MRWHAELGAGVAAARGTERRLPTCMQRLHCVVLQPVLQRGLASLRLKAVFCKRGMALLRQCWACLL